MRQIVCRLCNRALGAAERLLPRTRPRICPCCGWRGLRFRTFSVVEYLRHDAICPGCGSFERHRALARFYPGFFASLARKTESIVHIAPEKCLEHVLLPLCDRYERSNFGKEGAIDLGLDLTDIELPDESCDAFLLNHVLDCMADDRRAATEMYRVLKPGGAVLAVVGLQSGVRTVEFPVASNQRHRIYGSEDLAERFTPFSVRVLNAAEGISPHDRRRAAIPAVVPVLLLQKKPLKVNETER